MNAMVKRVAAAQATIDAFNGRLFRWGSHDCGRLVAHTLRGLGVNPKLTRFGRYTSALGATRAIRKLGFADMAEVIDAFAFPRIAPAQMLPGDIAGYRHPTQEMSVSLVIAVGGARVLGFMEEDLTCHIFAPTYGVEGADYLAWRTVA